MLDFDLNGIVVGSLEVETIAWWIRVVPLICLPLKPSMFHYHRKTLVNIQAFRILLLLMAYKLSSPVLLFLFWFIIANYSLGMVTFMDHLQFMDIHFFLYSPSYTLNSAIAQIHSTSNQRRTTLIQSCNRFLQTNKTI